MPKLVPLSTNSASFRGVQRLAIASLPPSFNAEKRSSAKRRARHRERVRQFIQEVVDTAAAEIVQAYSCSVRIEIWFLYGPLDDGDTDNRIVKTLQDALKQSGYFDDDDLVDTLVVHRVWSHQDHPAKTLVKLSPAPLLTEEDALAEFLAQ